MKFGSTETYNGSTVYATTTMTYNVMDQVTQVLQQAGSSGTGQTTLLDYDGHTAGDQASADLSGRSEQSEQPAKPNALSAL